MTPLKTVRTTCAALVFLAAPSVALAHPSVSVVMDSRGNLFFSDLTNIWRIGRDGSVTIAVAHVHSHQLYLGPGDTLYGEHLWYNGDALRTWGHRVWKRAPDGGVADEIAATPGFLTDYSFVRDAQGNHYWITCEGTLSVGTRHGDGTVERRNTAAPCHDPLWLWSNPTGDLFYTDGGALKRAASTGEVATLADHLNARSLSQIHVSEHLGIAGIWTDAAGAAFVANYRGRKVWRVPAGGGAPRIVSKSSIWWGPTGGLAAPNGDLWILESSLWNAVRVKRIRPDGKVTVFKTG